MARKASRRFKRSFRRGRRPFNSRRRSPSRRRAVAQTIRIVIEQPQAPVPFGQKVAVPPRMARFP